MLNSLKTQIHDIRNNTPLPMKTREFTLYIFATMALGYYVGRFDGWRFEKRKHHSK